MASTMHTEGLGRTPSTSAASSSTSVAAAVSGEDDIEGSLRGRRLGRRQRNGGLRVRMTAGSEQKVSTRWRSRQRRHKASVEMTQGGEHRLPATLLPLLPPPPPPGTYLRIHRMTAVGCPTPANVQRCHPLLISAISPEGMVNHSSGAMPYRGHWCHGRAAGCGGQ